MTTCNLRLIKLSGEPIVLTNIPMYTSLQTINDHVKIILNIENITIRFVFRDIEISLTTTLEFFETESIELNIAFVEHIIIGVSKNYDLTDWHDLNIVDLSDGKVLNSFKYLSQTPTLYNNELIIFDNSSYVIVNIYTKETTVISKEIKYTSPNQDYSNHCNVRCVKVSLKYIFLSLSQIGLFLYNKITKVLECLIESEACIDLVYASDSVSYTHLTLPTT
jgi:hypothetical protein